jgi:hypothetical protein
MSSSPFDFVDQENIPPSNKPISTFSSRSNRRPLKSLPTNQQNAPGAIGTNKGKSTKERK